MIEEGDTMFPSGKLGQLIGRDRTGETSIGDALGITPEGISEFVHSNAWELSAALVAFIVWLRVR